jgi:4'-phosphopantetheinyl transferase
MISSDLSPHNAEALRGLAGAVMIDSWPCISARTVYCIGIALDDCDALALERACHAVADANERARADRLRRAEDRLRHLVGRAALRGLLAANWPAADSRPNDGHGLPRTPWQAPLTVNAWGKPELPASGLHFNLSHSGMQVWLAACRDAPVGIDVEQIGAADSKGLAAMLHPQEASALAALPEAEAHQAFYRCWCRKEAVSKAAGIGLSLPFEAYRVAVDARDRDWLIEAPAGFEAEWTACDVAVPNGYRAAVAVPGVGLQLMCAWLPWQHLLPPR